MMIRLHRLRPLYGIIVGPRPISIGRSFAWSTISNDEKFKEYLSKLTDEYKRLDKVAHSESLDISSREKLINITHCAQLVESLHKAELDLKEIIAIISKESDDSMLQLLAEERKDLEQAKDKLCRSIVDSLVTEESDGINEVIIEVQAGVGGQEAGLFAYELFSMYENLCRHKGWNINTNELVLMEGTHSMRSVNKINAQISGLNVYTYLKFESGVHRVQRVPMTEKAGRIHTSTAVVILLPKPNDIEIEISSKDLKIDTFRSGGGGGQGVNKVESAVRLTHLPTGIVVECQQDRSQLVNRRRALDILRSRLFESQLTVQQAKTNSMRKLQIGGANRNEKIRTYNYPQGRVTDHRVKLSSNALQDFLLGNETFWLFLEDLYSLDKLERLKLLIGSNSIEALEL